MHRCSLGLLSLLVWSRLVAQVANPVRQAPTAPAAVPAPPIDSAALRPGRFDGGKMWTFDHPPLDYFQEAYGFRPDSAWLARARLGALRFATYCSASFVSARGLVLTNHHCSRQNSGTVLRPGENFDSTGFYAATQAAERKVPGLFVEQLLSITDVTSKIDEATRAATGGDQGIAQARQQAMEALEEQLGKEAHDSTIRVQVVSLYQGAEYSAYTYRRYNDVRLVMLPELGMGYFGGDDDNFTYPRYNLDFSIYRVYDASGRPLATPDHFKMSKAGAAEGDPVFVVGNPGSTSRLETMAQLVYARDVRIPAILGIYKSRIAALEAYERDEPEVAKARRIRTKIFGYANSLKAEEGQLAGLHDRVLFGRRAAGEAAFRAELMRRPELAPRAMLIDSIAEVAREMTSIGPRIYGFLSSPEIGSATLGRAAVVVRYANAKAGGAPAEQLDALRQAAIAVPNTPLAMERRLIAAQIGDLVRGLGSSDSLVIAVLANRSPDSVAADMLAHTQLADSANVEAVLASNLSSSSDAAIAYVRRVTPVTAPLRDRARAASARAENLGARLGRARFDVYGRALPPDATFTLRLADGRVAGYPYNGTWAPPFTTFYGVYERNIAAAGRAPWNLPARWKRPPVGLNLGTQLDLVTTNDIIGGNSGSPLLNRNLEVVGLIFDGNMESLPGEFIYTDERARALSVDVRGILAALRTPYRATRILLELKGGSAGQ